MYCEINEISPGRSTGHSLYTTVRYGTAEYVRACRNRLIELAKENKFEYDAVQCGLWRVKPIMYVNNAPIGLNRA